MVVKVSKPEINVREKISELDKPSGTAGQAMLAAETPQEQFNLIGAGRRNWVINGDFSVSQRGDFTTASSASDTAYTVDRFKNFVKNVNANILHTKATTVDGEIKNTLKIIATNTNSGRLGLRHYVESGSNGRTPLAGKTATVSVWMRSNNPNAGFYLYDYGNGGYFYRIKHSGGGQWEKLILTFPVATGSVSSNNYGYELNFAMQSNTNGGVSITSGDYVEIAEPQLELGKVATPFEHRSYGEELALCQRYYEVFRQNDFYGGDGYNTITTSTSNGSNIYGQFTFKTVKRARPSAGVKSGTKFRAFGNGSYLNLDATEFYSSGTEAVRIRVTTNAFSAGQAACLEFDGGNSSNGYIYADAEL